MGSKRRTFRDLGWVGTHSSRRFRSAPRTESKVEPYGREMRKRRRWTVGPSLRHERLRDSENGVGIDVIVIAKIYRRDQFAISRCADQKVDMSGAVSMPPLRANHIAHRAVHRDQVTKRAQSPQIIAPFGVGVKRTTHVHDGRVVLLKVVHTMIVRLPNLYRCVRNR